MAVRIGVEFRPPDAHIAVEHNEQISAAKDDKSKQTEGSRGENPTRNLSSYSPLAPPHPISINFFYSEFGAKLVMPLVAAKNENSSVIDKRTDRQYLKLDVKSSVYKKCSDPTCFNSKMQGNEPRVYCFDDSELRMKQSDQNYEFTPRIKQCRSYWRTVWQGAKVTIRI